jgi:sulfite exporter TauE/SafE
MEHTHQALISINAGGFEALLGALFLAGLAGSITHCAPMCGPFVLAQVATGLERTPAAAMSEWTRLKGAALIPYHLGRFTTYCTLGAIAAWLVQGLAGLAPLRYFAAALLLVAALAFLAQALGRSVSLVPASVSRPTLSFLSQRLAALAQPLIARSDRPGTRYLLGVVLGFLPCGLLYGALAAAATAGSASAGAVAMAAFTLGTVPALIAVGFAGGFLMRRAAGAVRFAATLFMFVNAATLSYLAYRVLA